MEYSKKVLAHFKNPHNQGKITNPTVVGEAGNPVCGDMMKLYLKINHRPEAGSRRGREKSNAARRRGPASSGRNQDIIEDIKFETLGCAAAIAVSSILTDMVKGKTIEEAEEINKGKIVEGLGGLPPIKIHCSILATEALKEAIGKYRANKHI